MQNIKLDTNKENNVLKEIIIFIVIIFLVVLIILNFIVYIILPISLFIAEGIKFIKNKILRKERDKDLDRIIMDLYKLSDEARAGVLIIIYELGLATNPYRTNPDGNWYYKLSETQSYDELCVLYNMHIDLSFDYKEKFSKIKSKLKKLARIELNLNDSFYMIASLAHEIFAHVISYSKAKKNKEPQIREIFKILNKSTNISNMAVFMDENSEMFPYINKTNYSYQKIASLIQEWKNLNEIPRF